MFNRHFQGEPLGKSTDPIPQNTETQQAITTAASARRVKQVSVHYHNFDNATLASGSQLTADEGKFVRAGAPYDEANANQMKAAIEEFWKARGIGVKVVLTVVPFPGKPQLLDVKVDVFKQ